MYSLKKKAMSTENIYSSIRNDYFADRMQVGIAAALSTQVIAELRIYTMMAWKHARESRILTHQRLYEGCIQHELLLNGAYELYVQSSKPPGRFPTLSNPLSSPFLLLSLSLSFPFYYSLKNFIVPNHCKLPFYR